MKNYDKVTDYQPYWAYWAYQPNQANRNKLFVEDR